MSLATKKVKRNGLLSPINSILARPPRSTHFPDATRNVTGSTCLATMRVRKRICRGLQVKAKTDLLIGHDDFQFLWGEDVSQRTGDEEPRCVIQALPISEIDSDELKRGSWQGTGCYVSLALICVPSSSLSGFTVAPLGIRQNVVQQCAFP